MAYEQRADGDDLVSGTVTDNYVYPTWDLFFCDTYQYGRFSNISMVPMLGLTLIGCRGISANR